MTDLIVVGGGVAGLSGALAAAAEGAEVLLLTKGSVTASNSYAAQGGVAAAIGADDHPALHAADTHAAGRGLCRDSAVRLLTEEAPDRVRELVDLGADFDSDLGREGGHSRRRIVHAGGAETGRRIAETLIDRVRSQPRIRIIEGERVHALWREGDRCVGVVLGSCGSRMARATLLATGGYAALWARTTNPAGAVGDGLVLAYRAGATLADLELVQFHPTALSANGFLLSEALRGDGALLLDEDGRRFTDELAPRDVVARAIEARGGQALLDLRPVPRERYPSLVATLERGGYDPACEPVPVAPAAHYTIGGIATDLDGRTDVPGLYAAGECACTGVHGANRLASNSLLECLVFGRRAALAAITEPETRSLAELPMQAIHGECLDRKPAQQLWQNAGLTRNVQGLCSLISSTSLLARMTGLSGLLRTESRGVHYRSDHPHEQRRFANMHVTLRRDRGPRLERWA